MVNALVFFENGIIHHKIMKKLLSDIANRYLKRNELSVMDVGCGSGRLLLGEVVPVLSSNFSELVGVDKHQSMIEYCSSLNTDPRVSFEQLDITTKDPPKKFVNRFDLITSFFCLHYALDYSQAIQNIQNMLKRNGEVIYIHPCNLNPLYESYRELCKNDRWKPFLQDFKNYVTPFSGTDRNVKIEEICRKTGLRLIKCDYVEHKCPMIPKKFEESIKAVESFENIIPKDQIKAFTKDFHSIFCQVMEFDYTNEENLEKEIIHTAGCITVYAQKPLCLSDMKKN